MAAMKMRASHKNQVLIPGVHRFGRSKMYHKRGIFIKKTIKSAPSTTEPSLKKPVYIEMPIKGSQNGGTRMVQLKKSKKYHPTATAKKTRRSLKRIRSGSSATTTTVTTAGPKLRSSLKPGTILILLAGLHAGKRVVLLKQLASGLLLITGPFKINSTPLRRIHQQYVIATSTRLDISNVAIPPNLNDDYFRRDKKSHQKKRRQEKGNIFADVQPEYQVSANRKADQLKVDKGILEAIKENREKKMLFKYLGTSFALRSGQYPHKMNF